MLNERDRAVLYRRLSDLVGDEEAVGAMLSHFPPAGGDPLATQSFVRAEVQAMGNKIILWNIGFTMTWSGVLLAAVRLT